MSAVIANSWAGEGRSMIERLRSRCAFDARDWGETEHDAVLYAIVLGWGGSADIDGINAWPELAERFGWTDDDVARLQAARSLLAGL